MTVLGITGGSGSGKGEVRKLLSERGVVCIDSDAVYHDLISSDSDCSREIALAFGQDVRKENGAVDRAALADLIFSSDTNRDERLNLLNSITHKHVISNIKKTVLSLKQSGTNCVAVEVPLLFESGFDRMCDINIAVLAPRSERIKRIISRDKITADRAEKRIDAQPNDDFYIDRCSFVIYNNSDFANLNRQIEDLAVFLRFERGIEI